MKRYPISDDDRALIDAFIQTRGVTQCPPRAYSKPAYVPEMAKLTDRDRRIMDLLADGLTYAQTAEALGIKRHVVGELMVKRLQISAKDLRAQRKAAKGAE